MWDLTHRVLLGRSHCHTARERGRTGLEFTVAPGPLLPRPAVTNLRLEHGEFKELKETKG